MISTMIFITYVFLKLTCAMQNYSTEQPFYTIITPTVLLRETENQFEIQVEACTNISTIFESTDPVTNVVVTEEAAKISGEAGIIDYSIPFDKFYSNKIYLRFIIRAVCKIEMQTKSSSVSNVTSLIVNKTIIFPVKTSALTFIETDKPIYKPNDIMQFRAFYLFLPSLRPSLSTAVPRYTIMLSTNNSAYARKLTNKERKMRKTLPFDYIRLESPSKIKMAEWKDMKWQDAVKGLMWKFSEDPEFGIWKLTAQLQGHDTEIKEFEVKKYVIPKFYINILPPDYVTLKQKYLHFSVCCGYTTGKPMKANVTAKLCIESVFNTYHRTKTTLQKRPCIFKTENFEGNEKCKIFNVSTDTLNLLNKSYGSIYYQDNRIVVTATIIENGTGDKLVQSADGGKLELAPFKYKFESPNTFKTGLPFYGKLYVLYHDNLPVINTAVKISFSATSSANQWGFTQSYLSDKNGVVEFNLPPFSNDVLYGYIIARENYTYDNTQLIYRHENVERPVEVRKYVSKWFSPSETYLQVKILDKLASSCSSKSLILMLQANTPINSKLIFIKIQSGGKIVHSQKIQPAPNVKETCKSSDNNERGHYTCVEVQDNKIIVKCLPGWTNTNCLTPICKTKCIKGMCILPDQCQCQNGWTGKSCNQCIKSPNCKNGDCAHGNDCICKANWMGRYCNISNFGNNDKPKILHSRDLISNSKRKTDEFNHIDNTINNNEFQNVTIFEREIEITLNTPISQESKIVIYFIHNNLEFVTHSIELRQNQNCTIINQQAKFSFSADQVKPKAQLIATTFTNNRMTDSYCGLAIRDIALKTFGKTGGVDIEVVLKRLAELTQIPTNTQKDDPFLQKNKCNSFRTYGGRIPNFIADASNSFKETGLFVLSNVAIATAPCPEKKIFKKIKSDSAQPKGQEEAMPLQINDNAETENNIKTKNFKKALQEQIRSFFPESWIFQYFEFQNITINLTVPDSLTTWEANWFCVSTDSGLQTAPPSLLTVFQPFSMQMSIPYSLIRNEIVLLPVKLLNYNKNCYGVAIKVDSTKQIELLSTKITELCICEDGLMHVQVKGTKIGRHNITLTAVQISLPECVNNDKSNDNQVLDAIKHEIIIEPEGLPDEITSSDMLCTNSTEISHVFNINPYFNNNLVEGSMRGYFSWSGNVMGSTLSNLEHLVKLPYGCGEQNMLSMVPSIYVLQYFYSARIRNEILIKNAKQFITYGYQRQLGYKLDDGSYSAFGKSDKIGSTWLTAFVYKSFIAASKYINNIDKVIIESARKFLLTKQRSHGCFVEDGRVFSKSMQGGLKNSKSDDVTLTAYIVIALLETSQNFTLTKIQNDPILVAAIHKAAACISSNIHTNIIDWDELTTYSIALRSYALVLYNISDPVSKKYVEILNEREFKDKTNAYWTAINVDREKPTSSEKISFTAADIETTAYSALVRLTQYKEGELHILPQIIPCIKWLSTQRNAYGGWQSTQDTIIGLQAISSFAQHIVQEETNLVLTITTKTVQTTLVSEENKFLYHEKPIKIPTQITIVANGTGCIFVQTNIKFHVLNNTKLNIPFAISVNAIQNVSNCNVSNLNICVRSNDKDFVSNMGILKIKTVTGWEISSQSISDLRSSFSEGSVRRLEVADSFITMYFDKYSYTNICIDINMERKFMVYDATPGSIEAYDYYSPDVATIRKYTIDNSVCNPIKNSIQSECPVCVNNKNSKEIMDKLCIAGDVNTNEYLLVINSESWRLTPQASNDFLSETWKVDFKIEQHCKCHMSNITVIQSDKEFDINLTQPLGKNKIFIVSFTEQEFSNFLINLEETCSLIETISVLYIATNNAQNLTTTTIMDTNYNDLNIIKEPAEDLCPLCFLDLRNNDCSLLKDNYLDKNHYTFATALNTKSNDSKWIMTTSDENTSLDKNASMFNRSIDLRHCVEKCNLKEMTNNYVAKVFMYSAVSWKMKLISECEVNCTIYPDADFIILSSEAQAQLDICKLALKTHLKNNHTY